MLPLQLPQKKKSQTPMHRRFLLTFLLLLLNKINRVNFMSVSRTVCESANLEIELFEDKQRDITLQIYRKRKSMLSFARKFKIHVNFCQDRGEINLDWNEDFCLGFLIHAIFRPNGKNVYTSTKTLVQCRGLFLDTYTDFC